MIDNTARDLAQRNDVVSLFQHLGPMWIVPCMQILEELLQQGIFYPNANRYQAELQQAGIFVGRMQVAMSAVLHKAGKSITWEKFEEVYRDQLKSLPDQQQREIRDFWKAGRSPGLEAGQAELSADAKIASFDKYVDQFVECLYDINYRYQDFPEVSFYYSPFLRLTYRDGARLELNIDTDFYPYKLTSAAARDEMAKAKFGRSGRLFPLHLAEQTAPRLWEMRADALRLQNMDAAAFQDVAMAGVAFVLTVPTMPAGAGGLGGGAKVTRRRVPGVVRSDGQKLLPRLSVSTQEQILAIAKEHPGLTSVNAERALRGPSGAVATLSGAERAGAQIGKAADIEFRQLTPNGNVVLRREVKVWTGTQGRFNAAVSDAADQIIAGGGGGEIFIQAPAGTNARSVVQSFKNAGGLSREAQAARLGRYRSIKLTMVDEAGTVLLDEMLELPALRQP